MALSYRLHSSMDIRPDEGINESPKRIIFLSVEGNKTEKNYFENLNRYRQEVGIEAVVHIATLSRPTRDTCSDPESVYALLKDFLRIREEGILPEDLFSELGGNVSQYSLEKITAYLNGELSADENEQIEHDIQMAGIDLDYHKFLNEYRGEQGNDVFGIVIDRDYLSHTEETLKGLFEKCDKDGNYCFLTNPCFEFWLLLHVCDVAEEFKDHIQDLLKNEKLSIKHTYVSNLLLEKAGHSKGFSSKKFEEIYLHNIDQAMKNISKFEQSNDKLLTSLGSSIPNLFRILREKT